MENLQKKLSKANTNLKKIQTKINKNNREIQCLQNILTPIMIKINGEIDEYNAKNTGLQQKLTDYQKEIDELHHQLSLLNLATPDEDEEIIFHNKLCDLDFKLDHNNYLPFNFTVTAKLYQQVSKHTGNCYDNIEVIDYSYTLDKFNINNNCPDWINKLPDSYIQKKQQEIQDHYYKEVLDDEDICLQLISTKKIYDEIHYADWDDEYNTHEYHISVPCTLYVIVPPSDLEKFGISQNEVLSA